jgi:hypothetical protein
MRLATTALTLTINQLEKKHLNMQVTNCLQSLHSRSPHRATPCQYAVQHSARRTSLVQQSLPPLSPGSLLALPAQCLTIAFDRQQSEKSILIQLPARQSNHITIPAYFLHMPIGKGPYNLLAKRPVAQQRQPAECTKISLAATSKRIRG